MPAATFLGTTLRVYTQYLDFDPAPAGTTLVAEPLGTYEIAVADNWQLGVPPGDGLWGAAPLPVVPGFNAIPGVTLVGQSSPGYPGAAMEATEDSAVLGSGLGDPLTIATSVAATFLGTSPRTYTQYLDTDPDGAGTTLVAEPLNTYQIAIADNWQNLAALPGDGLWGGVPRGVLSFTITPGLAVIGGMTIGFPGFTSAPELMEAVFAEPVHEIRVRVPAARVVRGRARKLRPAPARRGKRAGARRVRH